MSLWRKEVWILMDREKKIFPGVNRWGIFSLVLLALLISAPPYSQAQGNGKEIVLVHSNNLTGYLFPCPT